MADSKHLLYLLPDVAYAAELVPSKEGAGYAVRDYLQVNGEFMNEDEILEGSLKKLVEKVQPQAYELILPDFLFTNTVVSVDKTGEEAVSKHVLEELAPSLDLSTKDYDIQAFMLTELKGSSRAQLSALELSVLEPLRKVFNQSNGPSIRRVYPLSWTLKSLISLEPSISVIQLGANLYLAQHYIGVDQANNAQVEDIDKLVETIKTLKGAEPSIQTVYLLSSTLVEKKLEAGLKETLPLQQLAADGEESEMPSYVKQVLEASAKTLAVSDYKVPVFAMGAAVAPTAVPEKDAVPESDDTKQPAAELPTPTEVGGKTADEEEELEFADAAAGEETADEEAESEKPEEVDLSQFSDQEKETDEEAEVNEPPAPVKPADTMTEKTTAKPSMPAAKDTPPAKKVIKNETGTNNMVRMIFIGLVSFFITVGVGLGIGLGLLTFTQDGEVPEPTPTAEVSPTPAPSPTPTPAPAIDRSEHSVLVVNATTIAGHAGDTATALEEAGFESVDAANASGDYDEGVYVLLDEEDQALIDALIEDTGLDLVYAEGKEVEDSAGEYTIVIVLAE